MSPSRQPVPARPRTMCRVSRPGPFTQHNLDRTCATKPLSCAAHFPTGSSMGISTSDFGPAIETRPRGSPGFFTLLLKPSRYGDVPLHRPSQSPSPPPTPLRHTHGAKERCETTNNNTNAHEFTYRNQTFLGVHTLESAPRSSRSTHYRPERPRGTPSPATTRVVEVSTHILYTSDRRWSWSYIQRGVSFVHGFTVPKHKLITHRSLPALRQLRMACDRSSFLLFYARGVGTAHNHTSSLPNGSITVPHFSIPLRPGSALQ